MGKFPARFRAVSVSACVTPGGGGGARGALVGFPLIFKVLLLRECGYFLYKYTLSKGVFKFESKCALCEVEGGGAERGRFLRFTGR